MKVATDAVSNVVAQAPVKSGMTVMTGDQVASKAIPDRGNPAVGERIVKVARRSVSALPSPGFQTTSSQETLNMLPGESCAPLGALMPRMSPVTW